MGFPPHVAADAASRRKHLHELGFHPRVVEEIVAMADGRPPLLEEWGVSPKAVRLIASLHAGSWFRDADCTSVAETRQGGRQGCKLGSTVFNTLYAEAVVRLVTRLRA